MNNNVLKISKIETSSLIDKQSGYNLMILNDMLLNVEIVIYKKKKNIFKRLRLSMIEKIKNPKKINDKNISSVVCYNQISKKIKKIVKSGHTMLLEKMAEKIFEECFKNKRIETMKIRLEKLDAIKEADSAGIEVERSRIEQCKI